MHPLIEEFCRAQTFQPTFLRRCQRELREVIQPMLDERDVLLLENQTLKQQLEAAHDPPPHTSHARQGGRSRGSAASDASDER